MDLNSAKNIMNYFGFRNNSLEPTLCNDRNNKIGLFITFKTLYGHLSRFISFLDEKEMKNFMKVYLFYRKHINDESMNVVFDNYEKLSPAVSFYYHNILVNEKNLDDLNILNTNIEKLIIDTTLDENIKLLEVIKSEVIEFINEIKSVENELEELLKTYKEKVSEYKKTIDDNYEETNYELEKLQEANILKRIEIILQDVSEINFDTKYNELIETYKNVLNNEKYYHNIYSIELVKNEINKIEELKNRYENYINSTKKKSGIFKKKISFQQYLNDNPLNEIFIDEQNVYNDLKIKNSSLIIKWVNNSYDDLKKIYGIVKNKIEEKNVTLKTDINDLENYFNNLSKKTRNECLIISSPLKELINIIINFDSSKDIYNTIMSEEYYKNKFNEMYIVLSNKDNYALARKYLKLIKLDTLEEFVNSLIDFVNNLNIETLSLNHEDILKYKMGVILKKGFINASLKNQYPINNRGDNNYYISNLKTNVKAYYSPYIIKFDDNGILQANKNEDIITFDITGLRITDRSKVKVNNFMLKRFKKGNDYNFDFVLFNEKIYLETYIEKRL